MSDALTLEELTVAAVACDLTANENADAVNPDYPDAMAAHLRSAATKLHALAAASTDEAT